MAVADFADLGHTFDGNDLDAWDPEYIRRVLPVWRFVMGTYFRGEVSGLDNIPAEGPALLVGNHSGGLMIADSFVFAGEFYEHFGPERRFHQLAHDIAARFPATGLSRWGTVAASHDNARQAFDRGAPVLVYPGGDYETFRPSWHSDRIEFGGRKGFVRLALERGVPIVPVVAIGGQETALFVTRGQPSKITIEVQPPIDLIERFGPDPDHDEVYEEVTAEMQEVLSALQRERTVPVAG
jgi:1-acyl-sn-glycerol-3-phosphate acyltransferase